MIHGTKKGFLALALISTLGLSAGSQYREDKTGAPIVEKSSKTKQAAVIAASVAANAVAAGAIALTYFGTFKYCTPVRHQDAYIIAGMMATIGLTHLSSQLIEKMGLKTDAVSLHALSTGWLAFDVAIRLGLLA